jgi:putative PIN family toxin of toxin-antitoxin system
MRVVLDTNVLVSALIVKVGKSAQIIGHIGVYNLVTSEEILAEASETLHRPHIQKRYPVSPKEIKRYIERLQAISTVVKPSTKVTVIKDDPDDDKFLALAKEAGADYLVSGDPHLTDLGEYEGIPILTPAQFLEVLKGGQRQ